MKGNQNVSIHTSKEHADLNDWQNGSVQVPSITPFNFLLYFRALRVPLCDQHQTAIAVSLVQSRLSVAWGKRMVISRLMRGECREKRGVWCAVRCRVRMPCVMCLAGTLQKGLSLSAQTRLYRASSGLPWKKEEGKEGGGLPLVMGNSCNTI